MKRITRHHVVTFLTAMLTLWSAIACKCLPPIAAATASSSPALQGGLPGASHHQSTAHTCCTTKPTQNQPAAPTHTNQPDCNHCLTSTVALAPTTAALAINDLAFAYAFAFVYTPATVDAPPVVVLHLNDAREGPPPRDALTLRAQHTLLTV